MPPSAFLVLLVLTLTTTTRGALVHRPISHHPTDPHALPRFQLAFLNDYPASRVEADGWGWLLARSRTLEVKNERVVVGDEDTLAKSYVQEMTTTTTTGNAFQGQTTSDTDLHPPPPSTTPPTIVISHDLHQIFRGDAPGFIEYWQQLELDPMMEEWTIYAPRFGEGEMTAEDEVDDQPLTEKQLPRLVRMKLPSLKSPAVGSHSDVGSQSRSTAKVEEWLCMIPPISILHPPPPAPRGTINDTLSSTTSSERINNEKRDRELAAAQRATEASALDPLQESLDALEHLRGGCLTHRAGWFTYAYCHASHVRQFREMAVKDSSVAEGWVPAEDPNHEAYDLGVSPAEIRNRLEHYSDLTNSRGLGNDHDLELQLAAYEYALSEFHHHHRVGTGGAVREEEVGEVELVQNSQGKYLVQRWSGGTVCDMTGRPRRIEIQFHCRMGGVDEISSIKEIATCQYLMTIHSPHLCSLPGFHIPTIDDEPSRPITCREIRDDVDPYAEVPSTRTPSDEHHDGKQHAQTQGHEGQSFPRGYPIQPHGAQWHAHNPPRDGGRVIYETTKVTANDELSALSPHNVVVDPGPAKRRKSAKAAQADQMDDQSRKTWLAEQRAQKIAMREKLAVVEEKIKEARQELWDSRWDVRFVRRFGWVLGVDEAEYREWWEALIEEQEEENEKEREGRKMKV